MTEVKKSLKSDFMSGVEACIGRIPRFMVFVFVASLIICFLVHGYCFENFLTNHDNALISNGAGGIVQNGGAVSSGRFLLTTINEISSRYTMPWINGLLSSVYFAVAVCLITALFEIKHRASALLIAALLASFPTAASTFAFMYTSDAYFFTLMLSALAAYLTRRIRFGFVVGALLISAALGIYQAYFPFAAALLVFSLIFDFLKTEQSAKKIIIDCFTAFLALACGLVIYKLVLDFCLSYTGTELSSYIGIDHMWYISIWDIGERISDAFKYSFLVYKANEFFADYAHTLYMLGLAAMAVLAISALVRRKIYRTPFRFAVILLLIIVAPLACSLVFVMCESVHTVMIYAVALPLVAAVAALDKLSFEGMNKATAKAHSVCALVLLFSLVGILFQNVIVVNKAYLKMDVVYESSYAFCTKLTARMEMTDGYEVGMPVVLLGSISQENRPNLNEEMKELDLMAGIPTDLGLLRTNIISGFCQYFIGDQIAEADSDTAAAMKAHPQVAEMPIYPYNGSIRIIDGVMVVKLGEI